MFYFELLQEEKGPARNPPIGFHLKLLILIYFVSNSVFSLIGCEPCIQVIIFILVHSFDPKTNIESANVSGWVDAARGLSLLRELIRGTEIFCHSCLCFTSIGVQQHNFHMFFEK